MWRVAGTEMSDPDVSVKDMFDIQGLGQDPGDTVQDRAARPAVTAVKADPEPPEQVPGQPPELVPLEWLEAQICELAGNLTAATCRFLVLLGDFDARQGWASWEMGSCAQWLSWKCQLSSGAAREHVRVARALRALPVITAGFAAGRLSYSKVRALTRIADPVTEAGRVVMALPMTASQLDRFARAHRQVSDREEGKAAAFRRLSWRVQEDGTLAGTFRLPPLEGQVLLKALRAATGDLEHPHSGHDSGHDSTAGDGSTDTTGGVPAGVADASAGDVPAGTSPASRSARPWSPAGPGRCHVEDGPAVHVSTMQMLTCEAALGWMLHDQDGSVLNLGRRRRRPSAAIRRAARERDKCRCRFPGCESRRIDLYHIQYWSNGGQTKLENLVSLCKAHHRLVHKRGYLISAGPGGSFSFWTPDGTPVPSCPTLPGPRGEIAACHDADITPGTIIPAWYGDRLDLGYAIMVSLANAEHARQKAQAAEAMATAAAA